MTAFNELYACIYAREFPAQAMLRLRPGLREEPCVVMQGEPPLQTVCSCNAPARKMGVLHAMTKVEIDTFPSVAVLARTVAEEAITKTALLDCAGTFSPQVEDSSSDNTFLCVIDIAGTEKLYGPPAALARTLLERVEALGLSVSVAVSRNFYAAICLVRGMFGRKEARIIADGEESSALAPLPLTVLDLSEEHAETFSLWGIETLGMLAALPEKALIARMGQAGKRFRQLARGELPHLFVPVEPAFVLEERIDLDSPVELLESLLFVMGVMLEQLILRASLHMLALASVTVTLFLEGTSSHTRPVHAHTVRPALPTNDRQLWIKLFHLDLEAHSPSAPIVSLTLRAEPGHTSKVQTGLFSPQLPEPARLDITLARIRAIVGEDSVGRAILKDTHHPENFGMEPFTIPVASDPMQDVSKKISTKEIVSEQRAAMRRLRPVEMVTVVLREKRPEAFFFREKKYFVERTYGPWLTSGDWWKPSLWSSQQWDLIARSTEGALFCCCIAHELTQSKWQMVGFYD